MLMQTQRATSEILVSLLEDGFKEFFEKEVPGNPLKAEYLNFLSSLENYWNRTRCL